MKKIFYIIFVLLISPLVHAGSNYDFSTIDAAFKTFLNEDLTMISGDVEESLGDYWYLTAFAANDIAATPANNYKVVHVCNYDYRGNEIPVSYMSFVLNNNGDTRQLFVAGYYFITHFDPDSGETQNLIVNISRDGMVMYAQNIHQAEGNRYLELFRSYEIEKNPYRYSVLEAKQYDSYPYRQVMHFMENIGSTNSTWDDMILDNNLKQLSYDQTEGFLSRDILYKQLGVNMKKGILLAGPPGTGKSFLADVMISSILHGDLKGKATMVIITARHLEDNSNFRLIYSAARNLSPTAVFMEDIDLLGVKNRSSGQGDFTAETRLNEMLNGIDGLIDANHTLTVGTTNRIDYVDDALTRSQRLGEHIWYGLPSFEERRLFFNHFGLKMATWAPDVNDIWLSGLTESMSGADIIEIIRLAKKEALLANSWDGENLFLTQTHFLTAVDLLKRDHSADDGGSGNIYGRRVLSYTKAVSKLIQMNKVQRRMSLQSLKR
jgi:ATP-dependent 26S proteasome regulatory subunit